ncbi:hypothetical protein NFI96_001825 [Prochilodus magdalenae]|nr:hypothetical protein NFI96_001825 [Prochilodus magdalenae]
MSASVGPRGGPRPPTAPPSMPELPDLSHLTEEERQIIMAVMVRQKEEEAKEQAMLREEKPIQAKTVNLVGNKKPPQQNDISQDSGEGLGDNQMLVGEDGKHRMLKGCIHGVHGPERDPKEVGFALKR